MTTYVTYASSLQAGDTAPTTAANSGVSLAPYRSKEYEVGYKATFASVDFTAALFRIQRPFAKHRYVTKIFEISGEQVNRGLELSAIGEIYEGLTMYGGVQLLNARSTTHPRRPPTTKSMSVRRRSRQHLCLNTRFPRCPG